MGDRVLARGPASQSSVGTMKLNFTCEFLTLLRFGLGGEKEQSGQSHYWNSEIRDSNDVLAF